MLDELPGVRRRLVPKRRSRTCGRIPPLRLVYRRTWRLGTAQRKRKSHPSPVVNFVAHGGMVVVSFSSFAAKRNYQLSYESRTKLFTFQKETHFLAIRVVNFVSWFVMRKFTVRAVRAEARVPELVTNWLGTIAHRGRCNWNRVLQPPLKTVWCLGNVYAEVKGKNRLRQTQGSWWIFSRGYFLKNDPSGIMPDLYIMQATLHDPRGWWSEKYIQQLTRSSRCMCALPCGL